MERQGRGWLQGRGRKFVLCFIGLSLTSCSKEQLRAKPEVVFAKFDPDESEIPMPTNLLRDDVTGRLDLPDDDMEKTAAERELYSFMNTLDGWPANSKAEVEFSGPLAVNSITEDTVQIWQWHAGDKSKALGVKTDLSADGKTLTITPPKSGWTRGATIVIAVRGGEKGVMGARGEVVECEPAFYYLRQKEPLTRSEDFRAFPGDTRKERKETAEDLEELRVKLDPYFIDLEERLRIPREEVASLWTFTVNHYTEVEMDKESGKMPLPNDLLMNPKTGKLDIPIRDDDTERNKMFKEELRVFDGFGTTTGLLFEFNSAVDPDTLTSETVQLYKADGSGGAIPITIEVADDLKRVELKVIDLPLDEKTTYAIVIRPGVKDAKGRPVMPMLTGYFLRAKHPLIVDGEKQIESLEDEDVEKLEAVRRKMVLLMDRLGRDKVAIAWPFTTMSVTQPLMDALNAAETHDTPLDPKDVTKKSTSDAIADFALGVLSIFNVEEVYEGKIAIPDFLDPLTRAWYKDGSHQVRWIDFMMTVPKKADPDKPMPVVIFGHAICCERRFVLAVANSLAQRGYAAIAIDLPLHGNRTHCAWDGPLCLPNVLDKDGELLCPDPCESGSTCSADGKCRNKENKVTPFSTWPILAFNQASGAAFIEVGHIHATRHHFSQSITDLGALSRSLRKGDWKSAIGYTLKTDELYFIGQSLGGIIGATYAAVDPYIKRAVLNVPGANVVPMFIDSPYFGLHIEAFLKREEIDNPSAEYQKFRNVARTFTDAIDPINVARYLEVEQVPSWPHVVERKVLVQMATLDFIIPNSSTEILARVSGVSRKDYIAEHAFLVIPVEPAFMTGIKDAAEFIEGSFQP